MSALNSSKSFDELTEAEIQELREHDWSPAQIMAAISLALQERDMEAAVGLVHMLAVKDPNSAALIVAAVEALTEADR